MKNTIILLLLIFNASLVYSQVDCRPYLPPEKGSKWEITHYSEKGKEESRITYELLDKVENGAEITYKIKQVAYDKKGKEFMNNIFDALCINGKFQFDMAIKIDAGMMNSYEGMEMEMDATQLEIPSMDAPVGTKLEDGEVNISISGDSPINMGMTIYIVDREIEDKEKMTTPAGTFDCLVVSQKVKTQMVVNIESTSKEWYAENIGLVRSETYNKKGKLTGYSLLTKLEN